MAIRCNKTRTLTIRRRSGLHGRASFIFVDPRMAMRPGDQRKSQNDGREKEQQLHWPHENQENLRGLHHCRNLETPIVQWRVTQRKNVRHR